MVTMVGSKHLGALSWCRPTLWRCVSLNTVNNLGDYVTQTPTTYIQFVGSENIIPLHPDPVRPLGRTGALWYPSQHPHKAGGLTVTW